MRKLFGLTIVFSLLLSICITPVAIAAQEEKTLHIMHYMGEKTKRDGLDALVALFKELNPGVEVEIEGVDAANYITTYQTRKLLSLAHHKSLPNM